MTAAACALVLVGNWAVAGEDDSNDGAIRFRRVMVPEGRRNDWPVGDARHLPVKPDRFEELVTTARAASLASEAPRAARITEARYTARFDETRRVLVGEAALSVEQAAERVALLPLEPMDLPISDARWQADPPRDAELGLSADGRLELLVEQSGTLRFDWSLCAQNGPEETAAFPLELAPALVSRLSVSLPEGCRPVAEGALVRRERSDDDRQQWDVALGGRREVTLRIERGDEEKPRRPLTMLRESLTYDVSVHGLELSTAWLLEVHGEPLEVVDVQVDRPLKLVAARLDDEPVPWTILEGGTAEGETAPAGDAADRGPDSNTANGSSNDSLSDDQSLEQVDRPTRIRLTLPKPVQGSSRTLRLGALAPLQMTTIGSYRAFIR